MRILHTSDWHLGHRLYGQERTAEHRYALDWLLETIEREKVDVLIVAGDVFDTMNPSNTARNLYYDFLGRLQKTYCSHAVIVGGNHDSPSLLDAPAGLLSHLNVHLIGGGREEVAEQVVCLDKPGGNQCGLIVAAVPYLRERDLQRTVIGETVADRSARIRQAIREHYVRIAKAAEEARRATGASGKSIPILATGHLYAAGANDAEDKQSNIYLADRNNIAATHFPIVFDYVALGHIHRAQRIGEGHRIRYSGSMVPLTFGEARLKQSVCLLELERAGQTVEVKKIEVPVRRRLVGFAGTTEGVKKDLATLVDQWKLAPDSNRLAPWLEIRVSADHPLPALRRELNDLLQTVNTNEAEVPRILRLSIERVTTRSAQEQSHEPRLRDLQPEEVFQKLCQGEKEAAREDLSELLTSFRELRNWLEENEAVA